MDVSDMCCSPDTKSMSSSMPEVVNHSQPVEVSIFSSVLPSIPLPDPSIASSQSCNASPDMITVTAPTATNEVFSGNGEITTSVYFSNDNAMVSDGGRSAATVFRPFVVNSCSDEHAEFDGCSRPSSAPARTPTSAGSTGAQLEFSRRAFQPFTSYQHTEQGMQPADGAADCATSPGTPGMDDGNLSTPRWRICEAPSAACVGDVKQLFQCNYCTFSTHYIQLMQEHWMGSHIDSRIHHCQYCGFFTADRVLLRRHKRLVHQQNNPSSIFHCDKCHFATGHPRRMREHYSGLHGTDCSSRYITSSMHMCLSTFNRHPSTGRSRYGCGSSPGIDEVHSDQNRRSNTLNAFRLGQHRPSLQFEPASSCGIVMCGSNASSFFASSSSLPGMQHSEERPMSLTCQARPNQHGQCNHIMSHNVAIKKPVTSAVTSCEYPARPENPHRPDLNTFSPLRGSAFRDFFSGQFTATLPKGNCNNQCFTPFDAVKIKTEPEDCVSGVSSSGLIAMFDRDSPTQACRRTQQNHAITSTYINHIPFRPYEPTDTVHSVDNDVGPFTTDVRLASQSSEEMSTEAAAPSTASTDRGEVSDIVQESYVSRTATSHKPEANFVVHGPGVSVTKLEPMSTVTVAAAEHSIECHANCRSFVECGVQCEVLSSGSNRAGSRVLSADDERRGDAGDDFRCSHCGITFEDEVLLTIHIGCHSHTDPFVCNMCGKKCHNKYGFYSHIMRGHQA